MKNMIDLTNIRNIMSVSQDVDGLVMTRPKYACNKRLLSDLRKTGKSNPF